MNRSSVIRGGLLGMAIVALLVAGGLWHAPKGRAASTTVTFGNPNSTGSNDNSDSGFINGSPGVLSTAGTLTSLSLFVGSTPGGAHIRLAVYTNNGSNNPGTLVAQTAEAVAVPGWNTLSVPPGVSLAAGTYWIGAQTDNAQTVYKVTSNLPSGNFVGWAPRAYGAFPSTISGWQKFGLQSFDIYGTVTVGSDTTPPVIGNVQSGSVTPSGATVSWTTDEASTSQVTYGTTASYGSFAPPSPDPTLVTSHSQALSGLSPSTTYHYAVVSTDASSNTATSADFTFTTAADPCAAPAQPIVCENSKPGNPPSEWDVSGSGDANIQGFATDISVNRGGTVQFKVNTPASSYRLDIYRMGYYAGLGARKVATITPSASLPQSQPACLTQSATGLYDCGNWAVSASWAVPADAVSGIYFAKLVRTDGPAGASQVFFIVRDDASTSDILFQTSDSTWQAYNSFGGKSLYVGSPARATKVSYNRPFNTRTGDGVGGPQDFVFNAEYPMVRWLEANGYDVTYATDVDSDRSGSLILNHKVFMSVGHDEYWSGNQSANIQAARDAGVNLAFFSGNESAWKTRWENSIAPSGAAYRTLVTYKEPSVQDPQDPPTWTGAWRDPLGGPPADGARPENGLTGTLGTVDCCTSAITASSTYGALRFWRNTNVATLPPGGSITLTDGTLGYEWDESPDNGVRPRGLINLSATAATAQTYTPMPGGPSNSNVPLTHNVTLYRAPSGALVFGAGTVQWSWGLDATHDANAWSSGGAADPNMKQATVNLLADMHAQPATLTPGLVPASASADATAPSSTIASPQDGATLPAATPVTVTGTAADSGGGVVAGVEVSADGGATWHPASGRASWTYTFTPAGTGSLTIMSRATDDSANVETPGPGVTVTIGSGGSTATFGNTASTGSNDNSDFGFVNGSPGVLATGGTLQSLAVYVGSTPANAHIRMAVYTNNASGNPGTLLAQTGEAVAVQGWNTLAVASGPFLAPGTYWILAQTDNSATVYRVTGGLSASDAVGWAAQTYGAFPSSISGFTKQSGQAFDMYGTVAVSGGPTPTATATASATPTATPIGPSPTPTNTPNPGVAANPILVVVNAAAPNKLGPYLTEILKAEGFNETQQIDLSQVTLSFLQSFDAVLLAETPLTALQASMFNSYVTNGGSLIAMKPDAQLNATLGVTTAAGTTSEGYVRVDASKAPGAGIYAGTMQFHGVANNYALNGATTAATIYSDANTATSFPALTIANSGSGRAAAFAFDLAKSIAYTRQGNPAFAGQERDGQTGIRASDMFVGYLDLSKLAVPQADEQSRLLANTIVELTRNKKPLPRIWYLPGQSKAVYLPTDDQDDGSASTIEQMASDAESFGGRITIYTTNGCYQCPVNTDPVTAADVNSWRARGHTVGAHVDDAANATNPTTANMTAAQQADMSAFLSSFGGPVSQTVRNHWIVWVGWGQQGALETAQGIYLDNNYYTYGSWLGSNPVGYMTGSALPMLIFDDQQNATRTYGLVTQITDEVDNGNIGPDAAQLFDAALGTQGFYGVIVGNVHAYRADDPQLMHDTLVEASTRGIPIWNSDRFLQFTQMRHDATMSNIAWSNGVLTFTYAASGSNDAASIMVPASFNGSPIATVKVNGATTTFNIQTIKGVAYAFVPVSAGTSSISASYASDTTPPVISNVQVSGITNNSATVTWTTDEPADSAVHYGVSPATGQTASDAALVTQHSMTLSGLAANTQYSFFVSSSDAALNASSSATGTFTTSQASFTQTTYADFAAGTATNVNVTEDTGGELRLGAELYDPFNDTALGAGWTSTPWSAGGAATEGSGKLAVDGTNVGSTATFAPGRDLEASLTFGAASFEHFGFATDLNGGPSSSWALFSTMGTTDTLFARTMLNGTEQTVNLGSAGIGGAHNFRVSWQPSGVQYFIDGVLVATSSTVLSAPMSVHLSEFAPGGATLAADWVRVDAYPVSPGTFVSSAIDLAATQVFDTLEWTGAVPVGAGVSMQTRTSADGVTWSAWSAAITASGGAITSPPGRFIQYQATLTSSSVTLTPSVDSVTVNYHSAAGDTTPPAITAIASAPATTSAVITWTTDEPATSLVNYGATPSYGQSKSDVTLTTSHSVTLSGLTAVTTYHFQVSSTDASNNTASSADQSFATAGVITQTSAEDFAAGAGTGTDITEDNGGEVRLAPALNDLFDGASLSSAWTLAPWAAGGTVVVGGGSATIDGVEMSSTATFGPGSAMDALATFPAAPFTHLGVGTDLSGSGASNWAIFSTGSTTDTLFARTMLNGVDSAVSLGTGFVGAPHVYRIAWGAGGVQFFIDGTLVASNATSISTSMAAQASEFGVGAPSLGVDWYRITPYATNGTFVSSEIDTGTSVNVNTLAWTSSVPAGAALTLETRTSPDASAWSPWAAVASSGGAISSPAGRFIQYRATFSTPDALSTPVLQDVTVSFSADPPGTPTPTPTSTPSPTPTATPTPPPAAWWNGSFGAREQLNVQVGANAPFNGYNGYSVAARVDTASLVLSGKLRSDCNDLRVVRASGSTFTELDRDVIGCNTATTDVWFKLRADISASSSDGSYWLYAANPAAGAPPANRANVYLHFNDWTSNALASYSIGRQDNWQGTGTYTGFSYDGANQRVNFNTGDNNTGGLRLAALSERDVYVEQSVRYTGCYPPDVSQGLIARYTGNGTSSSNYYAFSQSNSSGCRNNPYTSPAIVKRSRTGTVCGSGAGTAWALDGTSHRMGFAVWGSGTVNLKGWLDAASRKPTTAPSLACTDASTPVNTAGSVVWIQAQIAGSFDDFLVRRYTEPEPALTAAALEVGP